MDGRHQSNKVRKYWKNEWGTFYKSVLSLHVEAAEVRWSGSINEESHRHALTLHSSRYYFTAPYLRVALRVSPTAPLEKFLDLPSGYIAVEITAAKSAMWLIALGEFSARAIWALLNMQGDGRQNIGCIPPCFIWDRGFQATFKVGEWRKNMRPVRGAYDI